MLYHAAWIGHRVFFPAQPAGLHVSGITSRGIFLISPEEKVIFLSYEHDHGPLTLNLTTVNIETQLGEIAHLENNHLTFPIGADVQLVNAHIWQPPARPTARLGLSEWGKLLHAIALEILHDRPQAGLAPLLGSLFDLPFPPLGPELHRAQECLQALLSGADPTQAIPPILGLGRGLTPSGDDFAAGYLLARSRTHCPDPDDLSRHLIHSAYIKTTTLSANLIESAAHGSADERLVQACDALITGSLTAKQVHLLLADYGSSSGLDAFSGMAAYLVSNKFF